MYKKIVTFLLSSMAAACLSAAPAWAQDMEEAFDVPIATAPLDYQVAEGDTPHDEPILLSPASGSSGPWLPKPEPPTCSGTAALGVQNGYFYPNYGMDVANNKPTSQGAVTGTCEDFTAEVGGSKLLSSKEGSHSERLANEWWVRGTYHPEYKTPIGRFRFEFTVSYRGLDHGQGLGATRDDSTELIGGIGYPMTFGSFEVMPCIRSVKSNPVGYNNSLYWAGECLGIKGPLPGDGTFRMNLNYMHNVNSVTAVIHRNVFYGSVEGSKQLPDQAWTITVGFWFSQYGEQDSRFDVLIDRDGRMNRVKPSSGPSSQKMVTIQYARISRAF